MTKEDIIAIFYRVVEMLFGSVIMSAVVCYLCVSTPYMPVESIQRDITLIILPIIYIIWNVFRLRGFFVVVAEKKIYYIVNLCATALYLIQRTATSLSSALKFILIPSLWAMQM